MKRQPSSGTQAFEGELDSISAEIDRLTEAFDLVLSSAGGVDQLETVRVALTNDGPKGKVRGALDTVSTAHDIGARSEPDALRARRRELGARATQLEQEVEQAIASRAAAAAAACPRPAVPRSPEGDGMQAFEAALGGIGAEIDRLEVELSSARGVDHLKTVLAALTDDGPKGKVLGALDKTAHDIGVLRARRKGVGTRATQLEQRVEQAIASMGGGGGGSGGGGAAAAPAAPPQPVLMRTETLVKRQTVRDLQKQFNALLATIRLDDGEAAIRRAKRSMEQLQRQVDQIEWMSEASGGKYDIGSEHGDISITREDVRADKNRLYTRMGTMLETLEALLAAAEGAAQ
jgi:hypothetical protein